MDLSLLGFFLGKGLEISTPIGYAALGGVFSERGGVVNIALEGIMQVTALTLVWGAIVFHSAWLGLLVAMITGVLLGLLHAAVTVTFKVDHVVSGVAINVFAIGLSRFLCQNFFGSETQSKINPYLFPKWLGINCLAFIMIGVVAVAWFVLNRTVFGLRLRSCGENPEAADTLGVNVTMMRYAGVMISGALCAVGSAALFADEWTQGIVAGRGFIALAAVIFGRWTPIGALLASLLFGYADTFRIAFETRIPIPPQFIQMFPYVLAVIVLAGFVGRSRAPAWDGRNYEKGEG